MDRRQLQYFVKLYETRNVTRAAEEMYLARQSLSGSIAKLEQELGVELFERSKDGVIPTQAADLLIDFARREAAAYREIEAAFDEVKRNMKRLSSDQVIRFGSSVSMVPQDILRALVSAQNTEAFSGRIEFVDDPGCTEWRAVRDKKTDVAFSRKLPPFRSDTGLDWKLVLPSRPLALMCSSHPLAASGRVDFSRDLEGYDYLCFFEEVRAEVELFFRKSGARIAMLPDNLMLAGNIIENSTGVAVLPNYIACQLAETQDIVACECENFPLSMDAYLIYRKDSPAHVVDFVDSLARLCDAYRESATLDCVGA